MQTVGLILTIVGIVELVISFLWVTMLTDPRGDGRASVRERDLP